jgi:Flp pilus assembly protein TadG
MRTGRGNGERGASLVEFALVSPILFMVLLGMITGGLALSRKLDLSTGAREAARYGATMPDNQFASGDGTDWAQAVAGKATSEASGALNTSGATVCVALVQGTSGSTTVYTPSGGSAYYYNSTYNGSSWVSNGVTAQPCYTDNGADGQPRVQVLVTRPDSLQAVVFNAGLTLKANADSRFESGL